MPRYRYTVEEAPEPIDDPVRDLSPQRSIEVDGNKLNITRRDPFGWWYISWDKGQLPERLTGAYTSFELAYKEAENYLKQKKYKVTSVKQTIQEKKE